MDDVGRKVVICQKVARAFLARRVRDERMWEVFSEEEEKQRQKDMQFVDETFELVQQDKDKQALSEAESVEKHRQYLVKTKAKRNWRKVRLNMSDVVKLGTAQAEQEAAAAQRRANKPALAPPVLRPAEEYSAAENAVCVRVQALFRAYRAKAKFLAILVALAEAEERAERGKELARVEEAYELLEKQKLNRNESDRAILRQQSKRRLSLKESEPAVQAALDPPLAKPLHCEVVVSKTARADSPGGSHVTTFATAAVAGKASATTPSPKAQPKLVRALKKAEIETLKQAKDTLERSGLTSDARYIKISRLLAATGQPV
jgi:hypothetical protein